jgi:hypothetical protein
MTGMVQTATRAGLRVEDFAKVVKEAEENIRNMGGGVTLSTQRLAGISGEIRKGQVGRQLLNLGIQLEDQAKVAAAASAQLNAAGQLRRMSDVEVAKYTVRYARDLKLLQEIAGKDAEKAKEELESLPAEELMEKATTVFHRATDGVPILYDYQFKGFLKEAFGIMLELAEGEIKVGKTKVSKWTYKRIVDNFVFVSPRQIKLGVVSGICTRPLRADTMKGERVSLASSEVMPAGTSFELEIETLAPALDKLIVQCLDYGRKKGLGQWRNSGKGSFAWEEVK